MNQGNGQRTSRHCGGRDQWLGRTDIAPCSQRLAAAENAIRGQLKLAAPSDLGRNALLGWLDEFQRSHPGVDVRLHLSDRLANIYSDPVDAALRYGKPPDSGLVALPLLASNRRVLCASPDYVTRCGAPTTPRDLLQHDCLCFMLGDEVSDRWCFAPPGGDTPEFTVRVSSRNVANDGEVVRRWALQGRGIAYKAALDVAEDIAQGRLQVLCPEWKTEAAPLFLVVPDRRQLSPLLRALRDFIAQRALQAVPATMTSLPRGRPG